MSKQGELSILRKHMKSIAEILLSKNRPFGHVFQIVLEKERKEITFDQLLLYTYKCYIWSKNFASLISNIACDAFGKRTKLLDCDLINLCYRLSKLQFRL